MNTSPFEPLIDLLYETIHIYESRGGYHSRKDLVFQIPQFLIQHLPNAIGSRYGFFAAERKDGVVTHFEGIVINPSPDLAITLFDTRNPLYKKDSMIVRIPLDVPVKSVGDGYEKYVFRLQQTNYFENSVNPINN